MQRKYSSMDCIWEKEIIIYIKLQDITSYQDDYGNIPTSLDPFKIFAFLFCT